jgi:hypothetical protein
MQFGDRIPRCSEKLVAQCFGGVLGLPPSEIRSVSRQYIYLTS